MDRRLIKKLDPVKDQVIESYNNGFTMKQIAQFHKVCIATVRKLLIMNLVPVRKRGTRGRRTK